MKAFITWFLVISIFVGGCASCSSLRINSPQSSLAMLLQQKTVELVNDSEAGSLIPYCSGVWIDQVQILTAAHCVEDDIPQEVQQEFPDVTFVQNPLNKRVRYAVFDDLIDGVTLTKKHARYGTIVGYDHDVDLALVKVDDPSIKHPIIAIDDECSINVGDDAHIVGHTSRLGWTYVRGYVSMKRNMSDTLTRKTKVIQISAPVWVGNSGGAAVNNEGQLLGVASFIINTGPNISFFIHRDVIIDFVRRTNNVSFK